MRLAPCLMVAALIAVTARAGEVLLPQGRWAFYSREPIELAVAGLAKGAKATVTLTAEGTTPVSFDVAGDGGTVAVVLPPNTLAPGGYAIRLDGNRRGQVPSRRGPVPIKLVVRRGVHGSTLYVSQTGGKRSTGVNFYVSNAFSFGLPAGEKPSGDPRKMSGTFRTYNQYIADDMPALIYMYWTGYVTHKPWGREKEWCSPDMTENMRLFSFHVAQRLRRFGRNFLLIGSIDEPGLPWGKTPAGGSASGFPGWNSQGWYKDRGWAYTNDPAAGSDADWMKYLTIRCGMIGEQTTQARKDIQSIWPDATYGQDLYALHAMMDGTDSWNQWSNDVPATHVFVDWGYGKLGALSGLYLEKCHRPAAKVAHAMNGQLFGSRVPQPQTRYAYHLMMNSLLAAGLHSNWWLNHGGMKAEDLVAVNEPAARIGPLFAAMAPSDHDVALLWSFTELGMRLKDITAREAKKKAGEPIKLMIAEYPETQVLEDGKMEVNAYSVGSNYKLPILAAHQALIRAGYPTHIVDERLLPRGALKEYKTLVIVGQTFPLPAQVRTAIGAFAAGGGKVVVDEATTVKFPGAITAEAGLKDMGHRWGARFNAKEKDGKTPIESGLYQTTHWADSFARKAAEPFKEALRQTDSRPVVETDWAWLAAERHVAGEAELHLVINTFERLGAKDDKGLYSIYNYAPYQATFTLRRVRPTDVVYAIEGLDWRKVSRVAAPTGPQTVRFEPGEMKLYLVLPHEPAGLRLAADARGGALSIKASVVRKALLGTRRMRAPLPLKVTVSDPNGSVILTMHRAAGADGTYRETLSLGRNAPSGEYRVRVESPIAGLSADAKVRHVPVPARPTLLAGPVRVFDERHIRAFLAAKPEFVVPYASDAQRAMAEKVAAALAGKGIKATARLENTVWHKAQYPRVWDPYMKVHYPTEKDKPLPAGAAVKQRLVIQSPFYDTPTVTTSDGKPFQGNWRKEGTLLTVGPKCFIETAPMGERLYEAGCKLYVDARRRLQVVNGEPKEEMVTGDFRAYWQRPWKRLGSYVGAACLVPQLPEAYECDHHLVLLGDSTSSELVRALQASELLLQVADEKYPGPGKALVQFAWSPFALGKNVIFIGATDEAGLDAGLKRLTALIP